MSHTESRKALESMVVDRLIKQVEELREDKNKNYKIILELMDDLTVAKNALRFYAEGKTNGVVAKVGERSEFGCGCCSGVGKEDGFDFDRDVVGLTAREALKKIRN